VERWAGRAARWTLREEQDLLGGRGRREFSRGAVDLVSTDRHRASCRPRGTSPAARVLDGFPPLPPAGPKLW